MEKILVQLTDTDLTNIYTLDELENMEVTEEMQEDFYYGDDFYISMTICMWRFCGYTMSTREILDICQSNPRWIYEYTWTKEQRSEFEHRFHKIIMKCLGMTADVAWTNLQQWSSFGPAFSLENNTDEYFNEYLELVGDLNEL